jgi:hypothetical protein
VTVDRCKQYLGFNIISAERTRENSEFFARMAHEYDTYESVCGVKGLSIWSLLESYDYVKDCVIDPMHHIYMHVVKETMDLWFSEKYAVYVYYHNTKH